MGAPAQAGGERAGADRPSDRADTVGRAQAPVQPDPAGAADRLDPRRLHLHPRHGPAKPPIEGVTEDHHGLSHHGRNPAKIEQLRIIERAEMAAFRDFLVSLRDTKEGAGSLLDQTQVLIGSNLGDASGHGTSNLPILLAGGGYRHGRHVAGDPRTTPRWATSSSACCSGSAWETDTFGSGTGTITGLS